MNMAIWHKFDTNGHVRALIWNIGKYTFQLCFSIYKPHWPQFYCVNILLLYNALWLGPFWNLPFRHNPMKRLSCMFCIVLYVIKVNIYNNYVIQDNKIKAILLSCMTYRTIMKNYCPVCNQIFIQNAASHDSLLSTMTCGKHLCLTAP